MTIFLVLAGLAVVTLVAMWSGVVSYRTPPSAPICPDCGKGEMRHVSTCSWYESATGYSDQRSLWKCDACGVVFEEEDLEREYLGNGRGK